ncbi:phosphate transporter [Klebsormidium nitens]|uniref:Phosphate transporter n=1 Tax=Klebsormidium nitens TaxID=105231 RepID=A0A1Y1HNC3_KLENI|nr:phosphate transporter [Klebsormidium nitens]|eukprot:GAQ79523.1 phosphate transporter [Klebsormidium nitens]
MRHRKDLSRRDSLPAFQPADSHLQSRRLGIRCAAASSGNQNPSSSGASPSDPGLAGRAIVVVTLVAFSLVLCNADRAIMSVAILPLAKSRGWGESVAGIVQSSFLWGYLFTPVLGGALADKLGGRQVLAAGILLWSAATLLTPWAANHSLTALLTTRAVMGFGEGVALPCMNNLMARWVGKSARARAVGLCMAGFHVGSMAGLLLAPPLMGTSMGVGGPFYIFGVLGFVWLAAWLAFVPDRAPLVPTSGVAGQEKVSVGSSIDAISGRKTEDAKQKPSSRLPPFGLLLSKAPTWAIIVANSVNNWGYFILLSWMPLYFSQVLKADLRQAASFAALPWAVMAAAGYMAAVIADSLASKGFSVTAIRKIMQSIGNVGPAIAIFVMLSARTPTAASLWLTTALGLSAFTQAGFLVNYQDIGPRYAGVLHGLSNTGGTLAGIAGTASTGYLVERTGSWRLPLLLTCALYLVSTVIWNVFATGERVFD